MSFTILLHSSKTMRPTPGAKSHTPRQPAFITQASKLADQLKSLSVRDIEHIMSISSKKAADTKLLIDAWTNNAEISRPAIDAFLGDIYSGLQVQTFSKQDREYADDHLLILSGLYGILRALDGVQPYRFEMGYKLPNLHIYEYWRDNVMSVIPKDRTVINISAVEYTKVVLPYIKNRIITPKFLTCNAKLGEPTFVTVHTKIARGAYAHWLIKNQIEDETRLSSFAEIGYEYDQSLSSDNEPVYVCKEFGGLGLSIRLT